MNFSALLFACEFPSSYLPGTSRFHGPAMGKVKRKVVTPAELLSAVMRPPCASTSERVMYRPRPTPGVPCSFADEVRWNRSKMRADSSAGAEGWTLVGYRHGGLGTLPHHAYDNGGRWPCRTSPPFVSRFSSTCAMRSGSA